MRARYVNELTALARGGNILIDADHYTLMDCGSRDIKFIRYDQGKTKTRSGRILKNRSNSEPESSGRLISCCRAKS